MTFIIYYKNFHGAHMQAEVVGIQSPHDIELSLESFARYAASEGLIIKNEMNDDKPYWIAPSQLVGIEVKEI